MNKHIFYYLHLKTQIQHVVISKVWNRQTQQIIELTHVFTDLCISAEKTK